MAAAGRASWWKRERQPRAHERGSRQHQDHPDGGQDGGTVLSGELAGAIEHRWRRRFDGLVVQVPLHVFAERERRRIPPTPVFLQGLHRDPVQLASHQASHLRRVDVAACRDRRQRLA